MSERNHKLPDGPALHNRKILLAPSWAHLANTARPAFSCQITQVNLLCPELAGGRNFLHDQRQPRFTGTRGKRLAHPAVADGGERVVDEQQRQARALHGGTPAACNSFLSLW